MSNQFYDYITNKLFDYFGKGNVNKGDKLFIHLDEENQVQDFYKSIENLAKSNNLYSPFTYKHEDSEKGYSTFSLRFDGINIVVAESASVKIDYLVTLRNEVTAQKGVWDNTALLIICHEVIDSIYNGMRDLQKKGMPLSLNSISSQLEDELRNDNRISKIDKEIVKFALHNQYEDLFTITLWDYDNILAIINKGYVDENDYFELGLFKDENLDDFSPQKIKSRLEENHDTFLEVKKFSQYDDRKEQLEKQFTQTGVNLLNSPEWYKADWKTIKYSKDSFKQQQNPLTYIESNNKFTQNGLVYWDKPNAETKAGRRTRNIIIFNENSLDKVKLKLDFNQLIKNKYFSSRSKNIASASGKSIKIEFDVSLDEPTFKTITYNHKNETKSRYIFNMVVLNSKPEVFESIKSRYKIHMKNKQIIVINDEDNYDIIFGVNKNYIEKEIEDKNDILYLDDETSISISDKSPLWNEGKLNFYLDYNDNRIKFEIQEKSNKSVPVKSSVIWNLKRRNKENFVFNDVKAVQDINSFYLDERFKKILNLEREIIKNNIFYATLNINGTLTKKEVHFSEELEKAYLEIFKYYQTFDDSPEDNLPSLVYLNEDLKKLYKNFIDIFNKEIEEIDGNSLSDYELKKDLIKLGRIDAENKIYYSSLSPINIAYQLEISEQCGNEDLNINMSERLVPNNLVPYICSESSEGLYRPIYQEEAQEWLIYEKSENVSIGTTNAFISNVVSEKLDQFVKHFDYLFNISANAPLKINLININDDKEIVKGVFQFIRSRLPDKTKTKKIIPIQINIYNDSEKSNFDLLFECDSKESLFEEFNINVKSDILDELDVIHFVQNNIEYYKHSDEKRDYEYAHISFYKVSSFNNVTNDPMDEIETGLSLNGLLSSVTSTTSLHSEYRTGFGTKNILNKDNDLVRTAINFNEIVQNSRNKGKDIYSKNVGVMTTVELDENNIEELYEKSHWVTFIEPTFGIEYFNESTDLIIIHYSDQYTSSSKYDTITVTKKSTQYREIITDFLLEKNLEAKPEDVVSVIKMFNCINGEWLLRIISNSGQYDREKLSIISAIKYGLAILDHEDIFWVPISMEEVLRIAGTVKLNKSYGLFSSNIKRGSYSDDLLFIGLKVNDEDSLEVIFYPIEVKIGLNNSSVIEKGKTQLLKTYDLLQEQLNSLNKDNEFRNSFFRNFFIQIFLSNQQKFNLNNIWDEKEFYKIEKFKAKLLNDDYVVSNVLERYIGKGSLISFKSDCNFSSVKMDDNNLQIIELPEDRTYLGLVKSINEINFEIQNDNTDIPSYILLSSVESLDKFEPNVHKEHPEEELEDTETFEPEDETPEDITEEVDSDEGDNNETPEDITEEVDSDEGEDEGIRNVKALIGTHTDYNNKIYWEFGNPSLGNRHLLIQGKSGQGKTYFIQRVLNDLSHQGISTVIIDYTDGFKKSKLEDTFKESLGDKIDQRVVYTEKFPLNPFKKNKIELDEGIYALEKDIQVAGRFKSVVNSVYNFGDQQLNTIYEAVLNGLNEYGEDMDLTKLKGELANIDSSTSSTALNKLRELLDINPFESNQFNWSDILDNGDGKVMIIQLTGLSKDIQRTITELILWDLWYYKTSNGSEDNPFIVILDEAQNLDFSEDSPCSKILTEGRKFGWSGWFATQSVKGSMKPDEIARLENVEQKFYFHPTDNSISNIASNLSKDNTEKKIWEKRLSKLKKGQCVVHGSFRASNGRAISSEPLAVDIDPIEKIDF